MELFERKTEIAFPGGVDPSHDMTHVWIKTLKCLNIDNIKVKQTTATTEVKLFKLLFLMINHVFPWHLMVEMNHTVSQTELNKMEMN